MKLKVGFIGVGKLGEEAANTMALKHDVIGYDVNPNVNPRNFKMVSSIKDVCDNRNLIFIAVPTPHDPDYDGRYPSSHLPNKDFDYTIVKDVLKEVDKHTTRDQLVVLISTVLPGTIRREFIQYCNNFRFIYNPYLIAMGSVAWDMVNPEMIIIGTEDGSTTSDAKMLLDFYKTFIKVGTRYEVGTWDEAEGIKIFYNTFISTKVALVNMIQDVAERQGNINVDVITRALANSTMRIMSSQYMQAGMGDGGGCHPRDNIALRWMAEKLDLGYDLFHAIMDAREKQAKNLANKLAELSKQYDLPIHILGESYKPGVEYKEGSTTILTGYYCKEMGYEVTFDDLYRPAIYLLGHQQTFNDIQPPSGSVILDVWREFKTDRNDITVIHYGNTRIHK